MAAQLRLHFSMFVDINAGANVTKKIVIAGISRNSGIINPSVYAIVSAEPVLQSEIFTGIKVDGVKLHTTLKIVAMHSF
jgi:hypothetical protein